MSRKPIRPVVEGVDAHLVGRVVDRGEGAAGRPHLAGEPHRGEGLVVERVELPGLRRATSRTGRRRRRAAPARTGRGRWARASAAGPSWAMVDPSWNSTIEWTCCWGWTTTSIRSKGMPKSRWASITSRPLLTRVAELVVMTRPIEKFGCARACSGVTSPSSARERPRKGPPLAVTTRRRTSSARPPRRLWAMALCSESTGTIWPGAAARVTRAPPTMSDSLFARARVEPAASAARVGRSPIEPVMPLRTTSAPEPASGGRRVLADEHLGSVAGVARRRGDGLAQGVAVTHGRRDEGRPGGGGLLGEEPGVGAGGEGGDGEAARVGRDDLERLGADRPGGAEEGDGAGGHPRHPAPSPRTGREVEGAPRSGRGHEVKTRSSMSRSETTRAAGW